MPGCVNGACNGEPLTCNCDEHWQGALCDTRKKKLEYVRRENLSEITFAYRQPNALMTATTMEFVWTQQERNMSASAIWDGVETLAILVRT